MSIFEEISDAVVNIGDSVDNIVNSEDKLQISINEMKLKKEKLLLDVQALKLDAVARTEKATNIAISEQNHHEVMYIKNDLKYLVVIKYFLRMILSVSMIVVPAYLYVFVDLKHYDEVKESFLLASFFLGLMLFSERLSASIIGLMSRFIDKLLFKQ